MPFTQRSATVILIYGPPLGSIVSAGNGGERRGTELGHGALRHGSGHPSEAGAHKCDYRVCCLRSESCPLPGSGGRGDGCPPACCWRCPAAPHLPQRKVAAAAPGDSCFLPKGEICVGCSACPRLSSTRCGGRGCFKLGGFLLHTACVFSWLCSPFYFESCPASPWFKVRR